MKNIQIGIIGYGDFTKVLIEFLSPYAKIIVSSRSEKSGDAGYGARFAPVNEVLAQPIIIPSIPSQFFEPFFAENKNAINHEALVIDVCSVKVKPLETLVRLLPKSCQIIGTHPLFGPASVRKNGGITGLRCTFSSIRAEKSVSSSVRTFLADTLQLKVIDKTPEQHDKEMAYVQGLSHYIGRIMQEMDIPVSELSTLAYDDLMDMKNIQGGDSWDLFASIMEENPYAPEVNAAFKYAIKQLDQKLKNRSQI